MAISIHKNEKRGFASFGWLNARYSFSFSSNHDPSRMGFGALRVLNDDSIDSGRGFGAHPHDNMEIVTIPLSGTVAHKDSSGGAGTISSFEVQHMSAGSGVTHSEFNASSTEPLKLLQIWIEPKEQDIKPRYSQLKFSPSDLKNKLFPLVLGTKSSHSLLMHQDGGIFRGNLDSGISVTHTLLGKNHGVFVFLISGEVSVDGKTLYERDSAEITNVLSVSLLAKKPSDVLLIEVPME